MSAMSESTLRKVGQIGKLRLGTRVQHLQCRSEDRHLRWLGRRPSPKAHALPATDLYIRFDNPYHIT